MDELGSGVRNITKYNKIYSGATPTFIEGDIFKTIIPLSQQVSGQVGGQVSGQVIIQENDRTDEILRFCKIPRSRNEIQCFLNIKSRSYVREKVLNPLIKGYLLKLTIPDKPTSSKQKYYSEKR